LDKPHGKRGSKENPQKGKRALSSPFSDVEELVALPLQNRLRIGRSKSIPSAEPSTQPLFFSFGKIKSELFSQFSGVKGQNL